MLKKTQFSIPTMLFSIITINRNNSAGLRQTMESVVAQQNCDMEYVVVDGASTDGSVDVIKQHSSLPRLKWVSEPDSGIYNAMNKGISMAEGDYIVFVNSGDTLVSPSVMQRLSQALAETGRPAILYGNIIKVWPDGRMVKGKGRRDPFTMFSFYRGTLDHPGTCIRRSLYDTYGMMDETMKICSDWAWFLKAIVFGEEKPVYADIDTVYFDMTGISESSGKVRERLRNERRSVLKKSLPPLVLADYDRYADDIVMINRLHRHPWAFKLVRFIERVLFKIERLKK